MTPIIFKPINEKNKILCVYLVGISGSGKSTIGSTLLRRGGAFPSGLAIKTPRLTTKSIYKQYITPHIDDIKDDRDKSVIKPIIYIYDTTEQTDIKKIEVALAQYNTIHKLIICVIIMEAGRFRFDDICFINETFKELPHVPYLIIVNKLSKKQYKLLNNKIVYFTEFLKIILYNKNFIIVGIHRNTEIEDESDGVLNLESHNIIINTMNIVGPSVINNIKMVVKSKDKKNAMILFSQTQSTFGESWKKDKQIHEPLLEQIRNINHLIIRGISATSVHHWSKDIRVEINDGKIIWFDKTEIIPKPRNAQEMIKHIDRLLKFTACGLTTKGGTSEELIALLYMVSLEYNIQLVHIDVCGCNMGNCYTVRAVELTEEKTTTYGDILKVITGSDISRHCFWESRKITYSTVESLVKALKKYNIEVDPQQIEKHQFNKEVPKEAHPHFYDYMDSVIMQLEIIKVLPLIYKWPYHWEHDKDKGLIPDIKLDPNITYVSCEWSR